MDFLNFTQGAHSKNTNSLSLVTQEICKYPNILIDHSVGTSIGSDIWTVSKDSDRVLQWWCIINK